MCQGDRPRVPEFRLSRFVQALKGDSPYCRRFGWGCVLQQDADKIYLAGPAALLGGAAADNNNIAPAQ